jgi:hypothetical protein
MTSEGKQHPYTVGVILNALFLQLKKADPTLPPLITYFQVLGVYARLLTAIISSTSFANHLHVLNETEYLPVILPMLHDAKLYMIFAKQHKMSFSYNFGKQKKQSSEDGNAPGQDVRAPAEGMVDVEEPVEWDEEPVEEYQKVGGAESFSESGLS